LDLIPLRDLIALVHVNIVILFLFPVYRLNPAIYLVFYLENHQYIPVDI
ncbi:hypothetical protein SASC598J21_002540, partial [Snodgrassella alvi SCGC AB-598-J21]